MTSSPKCQSCGMPLTADPKGGGTNADGSLSREYCSYCYVNGALVNPDMTLEEMKALVVDKLQEKGVPRFIGKFFALGLPRLKRWRKH
ncbi:MAG: zinc ribbon domain-containing protein [Fluviicoccus sp.]|uniref:zinc ribbon domain-containing protein n=1 Tax=Fluviicoccus sp. TaxID=2003552 RepID=UPI00271B0B38|nr:zinc ribbon domain-containing protein [Fluviicoccus sp.]MDO8329484.1 zinc ribbon domain-containing protein [Fluviicoccus sp.]